MKRFIVSSPGCRGWPEREPSRTDDLRKCNRDATRQHVDSVGECRHQARSWLTNPCRAAYFELGCISALADLCGNKNGARLGAVPKTGLDRLNGGTD
jgi:hypothetical protein